MPKPRRRWPRLALVVALAAVAVAALPAVSALSAPEAAGELACFTVTANATTVDGGTSVMFWVDGNENWTGWENNVCVTPGWHTLTAKWQTSSPWQRGADLTFDSWYLDQEPLPNLHDLSIPIDAGRSAGTTYTIYYADCCPPPGF